MMSFATTRRPRWAPIIVGAVIAALAASVLGVVVATPAAAAAIVACDGASGHDQNQLRVTPSHGAVFYIDSGQSQALDAAYAAYSIKNLDASNAMNDLWVRYDSFTGGVVSLANPADAIQPLGDLAASASASSFALLKAASSTSLAQSHLVHIYEGKPGTTGATELYVCSYTFAKVSETIKAAANKVTDLATTTSTTIGSTLTVTVQGNSGTIGAGNSIDGSMMWFSPAARSTWPTGALRLESTTVALYSNNGRTNLVASYANQLRIPTTSGSKYYYTATYTFRIVGSSPAAADVIPIAQISSGTQIKHTDLASISSASLATNTTTVNVNVTKTTANTVTIADGLTTFSYTVSLANSGAAVSLDSITDTRAGGLTYVSGTGSYSASSIADPTGVAGSSDSLIFSGPFALPAGTSGSPTVRTLNYQMSSPTCSGTFDFTNSATGAIGAIVIGSDSSHISVSHALGNCDSTSITTFTENQTLTPEPTTSAATTIGTTTARLNGLVDPNGTSGQPITFSYGTSPTLSGAASVSVGSTTTATSPYAVSTDLTALSAGTVYYFRVAVDTVAGDILSFVTSEPVGTPTVTTVAATGVTTGGAATFNGTVDPNQVANGAKVKFQYALDSSGGACTALGSITTTGFVQSETDTGTVDAIYSGAFPSDTAISLTGLTSGARYCFRTVAYYNSATANWNLNVASSNWMPVLITTKATQTITFPAVADTSMGQTATAAATTTSSLPVTYISNTSTVCTIDSSGSVVLLAAGTCSITANQPGNDSYQAALPVTIAFDVSKAAQTISYSASSSVVAGTTVVLNGTASSGLTLTYTAGPSNVCTIVSGALVTGPDSGVCTVTASQAGDASYLAATDLTLNITVTPGPPVITTTSLAQGTVGTPYDVTLAAAGGNGTYTSWQLSSGVLPEGMFFDTTNGRIYGTPTSAGDVTLRFTVVSATQTSVEQELILSIVKMSPTITASDLTFVYGDADRSAGASTSSDGTLSYTVSDPLVATVSAGTVHVVGVGATSILLESVETANYAATSVTISVTVTPAQLTVTAPSPSVTYGAAPPTYSPTTTGFVLSEDDTSLTASPGCSSSYSATSDAGSNPTVICLAAAAANYSIVYVDGVVDIAKAAQTITLMSDAPADMPPGSTQSFSASALGGVVPTISTTGTCTWSSNVLTAGSSTGSCDITVDAAESTNYLAAGPVFRTLAVSATALLPRTLVLELDVPGTVHTRLENLHLVTTVGPVPATVVWTVDPTSIGVCRLETDNTITLLGLGDCTIDGDIDADSSYGPASSSLSFSVVRAARSLELTIDQSTSPTGSTVLATGTPSAGTGTISYRLSGSAGHCSIAGDVITAVSVGTCDVVAEISADDTYLSATSAAERLTVFAIAVTPPPPAAPSVSTSSNETDDTSDPAASASAPDANESRQPAVLGSTGKLVIRSEGRLPQPSPFVGGALPGAPRHSSASIATVDFGSGVVPASRNEQPTAELSPAELVGEQLQGFAPGSAARVWVTGARTAAQFAVEPTTVTDTVTLKSAIAESRQRLAADFASVTSAKIGETAESALVLGGQLTANARETFKASGLDTPRLAGDLPATGKDTWLQLSAHVEGYVPGSVVYLAVTTRPTIIAAAVVGRDGKAQLSGAFPASELDVGGHNVRVVGTRVLSGVTTSADGTLQLDTAAMAEVQRFDPGTHATVELSGVNATGGDHTAVRIVLLGLEVPWWTVLALGLLSLLLLGLLLWRRPQAKRWTYAAGALLVAGVALPGIVGWLNRAYDVVTVGAVVGLIAATLVLLTRLLMPRQAESKPFGP